MALNGALERNGPGHRRRKIKTNRLRMTDRSTRVGTHSNNGIFQESSSGLTLQTFRIPEPGICHRLSRDSQKSNARADELSRRLPGRAVS